MMRLSVLVTFSVLSIAVALPAQNRLTNTSDMPVLCIDANNPINTSTGNIVAPPTEVAEMGTPAVRVNFILGPWSAPDDTTQYGSSSRTWFETYDKIVDDYLAEGVEVYGLIGSAAVNSANDIESVAWVGEYTDSFELIVDHFKDRVKVYESVNEPNNWGGTNPNNATVSSYYFAMMLESIYRRIKVDNGHDVDPAWNSLTLVSGPLLSHDFGGAPVDSGGDTGKTYLADTYQEGIDNLGWTDLKNTVGTYPLDGIGYHLYIREFDTDQDNILARMQYNLDECWDAVTTYEGAGTSKKFWVSEIGWRDDDLGSEANQSKNMITSFDELSRDERVKLITWFCLKDFPQAGGAQWGLYTIDGFDAANRKEAWSTFCDLCEKNDPENIQLQAEDCDSFNESDQPTDPTGDYRSDALDTEPCDVGGYNVGYIYSGEWIQFDGVEGNGGTYDVTANVASGSNPIAFSLLIDGSPVLSNLSFPTTNGFQAWRVEDVGQVVIPSGEHSIRFVMDGDLFNLDWIRFSPSGSVPVELDYFLVI